MALFSLGPLIGVLDYPRGSPNTDTDFKGPIVGPIAGGFIAQEVGIKWVFIVIASKTCPERHC
jgi:hypothetical protein